MTDFIPSEKGVPIRFPSEANLLVDSADRGTYLSDTSGSAGNFAINRPNNLMNGFFTRITPVEVALDWRIPNVGPYGSAADGSNNNVRVDVSGALTIDTYTIVMPTGQYTCADVLDYWVATFNQITGYAFDLINTGNMNMTIRGKDVSGVGVYWRFAGGPSINYLMGQLGFNVNNGLPGNPFAFLHFNNYGGSSSSPPLTNQQGQYGLSKYKYLDFVSPQLTNQQDVKDGTTSRFFVENSLFRWYLGFTNDNPVQTDKYGFPVYPTDKQFYIRRELASPKFIKWEANVPIGNLNFQVFATRWTPQQINNPSTWTTILDTYPNGNPYPFNWQMTLQASEV